MLDFIKDNVDTVKDVTLSTLITVGAIAIVGWGRFKSLIKNTAKCEVNKAVHEHRMECQHNYDLKFLAMEKDIEFTAREVGRLTNTKPPREVD